MVLWVADYFINFLSYYIVYKWILCVPFRKKLLLNIGVPIALSPLVIGLCQSYILGYDRIVISAVALLALMILVEGHHITVLLTFPIAFFTSGVISILVSYLFSSLSGIPYPEYFDDKWNGLLTESVFPIVFFVCLICSKKLREEREMVEFNAPQYLIALLGSVFLFFIIGVSQGMMKGKTDLSRWTRPFSYSMVVVGIMFVALVWWQSKLEKKSLQYKMENDFYQLILKGQEEHIREIVEKDQKIRRFRHDINAHLTALEQCVQTNDLAQLKSYVERMRAETRKLEIQKFTGIGVVDAIVSEWHQKAVAAGIQWEWEGGQLGETEVEPFDLCVLFSNLLSNAVEAAEQVEEGKEKRISISCGTFRDRICIRVSNTFRYDPEAKKRHGTTKSDYQNHGFGLMNIRNTVDKVNGEFRLTEDPGVFSAEIIL